MTSTLTRGRLTPVRVLTSEWVKLTTVRSTFWTSLVALLLAALVSAAVGGALTSGDRLRAAARGVQGSLVLGSTASLSFVALVVGVLGVLAIGGEYATLQIRSSYTAVPRRWPTLVAKAIVVGAWSFVLGLVVTFGGFGVIALFFSAHGTSVALNGDVVGALVGGAAYLAVVAVFAVGLGTLVRSSAAGITILTAILFVAPIILNLLAALLRADWATKVADYLLSAAGGELFTTGGSTPLALWAVVLTLAVWIAAAWLPAILTTVRRDV